MRAIDISPGLQHLTKNSPRNWKQQHMGGVFSKYKMRNFPRAGKHLTSIQDHRTMNEK